MVNPKKTKATSVKATSKPKYEEKIIRVPIKSKAGKKLLMYQISGARMTKKQIQDKANEISKKFHEKGAKGSISLQLDFGKNSPVRFGGSKWANIGEHIKPFNIVDYLDNVNENDEDNDDVVKDFTEPKYFSDFRIFVRN